jgi:hypothetical protein
MDNTKLIKKSKINHLIETSCLKKCLKWNIIINNQAQSFNSQAYFGDYIYFSNDELYNHHGFIDKLPINISQVQLLALEKGIDNRIKFNIEFDLSGIRTPFKTIDYNYGNNNYDMAINVK